MKTSWFNLKTGSALLLVGLLLAGCVVKPPIAELPPAYQMQRIGSEDADTPVAWHPDGEHFGFLSGGLMVGGGGGRAQRVSGPSPDAFAWSPTGFYLALSDAGADQSVIRIVDAEYNPVAEISLDGSVRDLAWTSDDELLLVAVTLQTYRFGGNYKAILYRWRQNEELAGEVIAETSPMKQVLDEVGSAIFNPVHLRLSPYHDEILFCRFLAPPNVAMQAQLVVRHLATRKEKILGTLPFDSAGGRYLQFGERVFFSDGQYQSINRSLWGTDAYETYPPGKHLEISPGGRYKLIDGSFIDGRTPVFRIADLDAAAFSPDGSKLLFASHGRLYLLSPLMDASIHRPVIGARLLELRRWRSDGLITPQDYEKYVRKLDR